MDIDTIRAAICDPVVLLCLENRAQELQDDCFYLAEWGPRTYLYEARIHERKALWTILDVIRELAAGETALK